ncbi:hypothetical protein HYPSUDRAFT_208470 [Hypholoma sublateritium FD-334 SS-4]|uniref:Uncharacterized protein n=1 Tax=Hypholoma sublateritium (strain FD-334 SS-4) TaxID=945553 RepID=A0A0D2N6M4_HYPSF|nr:hypothetical protein HYPSUDRAFT_208470 [Hypholoma sublateritium FD-334 SS-4]
MPPINNVASTPPTSVLRPIPRTLLKPSPTLARGPIDVFAEIAQSTQGGLRSSPASLLRSLVPRPLQPYSPCHATFPHTVSIPSRHFPVVRPAILDPHRPQLASPRLLPEDPCFSRASCSLRMR